MSSININENFDLPNLPQSIVWPQNDADIPWFMNRLYEQMALSINSRDFNYFPMAISDTASQIQNLRNFGAYLLCVGGTNNVINPATGVVNWLPSYVWPLAKAQDTVAGTLPAPLTFQNGTGDIWAGATLTLSSIVSFNNTQVYALNHNKAGLVGSFNIRIVGTQ